jgi:hypothetical protein
MSQNVPSKKILSAIQRNAIDLILLGKSDIETAEAIGVDRRTIYRWRYQNPWFQAELNRQLSARWKATLERVQALVPKVVDHLETEINQKPGMAAVRCVLNFVAKAGKMLSFGPASADEIIEQLVEHTRGRGEIDWRKTVPPLERAYLDRNRSPEIIAEEEEDCRGAVYGFLNEVLALDDALAARAVTEQAAQVDDPEIEAASESDKQPASQSQVEADPLRCDAQETTSRGDR